MVARDLLAAAAATGAMFATRATSLALRGPNIGDETTMELTGPQQVDFVKWVLEEGGLFVVILVILYFYRKDFKRAEEDRKIEREAIKIERDALVSLVTNSVAALNQVKLTNERLARAVEAQNGRFRISDRFAEDRERTDGTPRISHT